LVCGRPAKRVFANNINGLPSLLPPGVYILPAQTRRKSCVFFASMAKSIRAWAGRFTGKMTMPLSNPGTLVDSWPIMLKVKDTLRATVHLGFDGRVFKAYHGADAAARFEKEIAVLRHLEARGCPFVPRLLEADPAQLRIVTTNCGTRVDQLDEKRRQELFAELENFGVRHDDPDIRNVAYRFSDGRFCLIDFEFATILPAATNATP
jgi:hypothetical protein